MKKFLFQLLNGRRAALAAVLTLLTTGLATAQSANGNRPGLAPAELAEDGTPFLIRLPAGKGQQPAAANRQQVLRQQLGLSADDQLRPLRTETDALGFTHERYQQYYKGVKVEHGQYSVHERGGHIEALSGELKRPGTALSVQPALSETAALQRALAAVGARRYKWQEPAEEAQLRRQTNNPQATYQPKGELVLVGDFRQRAANRPLVLAWKFNVYAQEPISRDLLYVDAHTGQVVLRDAIIKHVNAPGTMATRYLGPRTSTTDAFAGGYRLRESTRGKGVTTLNCFKGTSFGAAVDFVDNDNNWSAAEYNNANFDNAALDAHIGAQATQDYWVTQHGRDSYDNRGTVLLSYVHYGVSYENAFWDGAEMVYGDGASRFRPLTAVDVCGHEIGHAVCETTAGLIYQNESGALNEGFSDIWGACVEYSLDPTKQTWLIGEDIDKVDPSLRSMSNPNAEGQPDTYLGTSWYTGTGDNGGVHYNSGVLNYWFYLLSVGGSGTNDFGTSFSVTGINITKAARIAYRAEQFYLTPSANYSAARTATLQAAVDLYGFGSAEVMAVAQAWRAVGLGQPAPVVSSFTPTSGPVGQTVTITGTNLSNAYSVTFNGTPVVSGTLISATQLSVVVPAGATTGPIAVTTTGGTGTSVGVFTVTSTGPAPTIVSYLPAAGQRTGATVVITGTNFTGASAVAFNGVSATFTLNSPTQITATVPASATTGNLAVTTPGGTAATPFTVLPYLASFSPGSGPVGTSVVLTGTSFSGALNVKFNGVYAATFTVNSATSITAVVPVGATTGLISVRTPSGTTTSLTNFTVTASLVITDFSPGSGLRNTTAVTISGVGFTGTTAVQFNGVAATPFTVASDTELWANVPATATTGPISVTGPLGTAQSSNSFVVIIPGAPVISSFTPTYGAVGTSVALTGTDLLGATAVRFNGTASAFTVNSATSITATVPAGATTGPITVTTPVGTGQSVNSFTVVVPPANDLCTAANLPVLTCGSTLTGTTIGATLTGDPTGTCGTSIDAAGGVFYRFVGTGGAVTLRTCGGTTNYDSKLFVFTGSCGNYTCVTGDDDGCGNTASTLAFTSVNGTQYLVYVAGWSTSQGSFSISATCTTPPVIASFTPTSGPVNTAVTLTGTNFTGASAVAFNGTAATFTVNSATSIATTVPAGATTGLISVTTPDGTALSASNFTVVAAPAPTNDLCTAANLPVLTCGSPLTGTTLGATTTGDPTGTCGTSIDAAAGVFYRFVGTGATVTIATCGGTTNYDSKLFVFTGTCGNYTCVGGDDDGCGIGGGASTVTFASVNGTQYLVYVAGWSTSQGSFSISATCAVPPTLTSFTPTSGPVSTAVTLTGTGFTGATAVAFNGTTASFTVSSATSIATTVPAGAATGPITVVTPNGTATSATSFTVTTASTTTLFEDIELGVKSTYTTAPVSLNSGVWTFTDALVGSTLGQDRYNGTRSARIRGGSIAMNFDKSGGAGVVSLKAALFNTDLGASVKVEVSTDGGLTYTDITGTAPTLTTTLQTFSFTANRGGLVRLRISNTNQVAGANPRINVDDINVTDFVAATPTVTATPASLTTFATTTGTPSAAQTITVSGANLTAALTIIAPSDYEVSFSPGSGYAASLALSPTGGTVAAVPVYVRLTGATTGTFGGNVVVGSAGATSSNVSVTGTVSIPLPALSSISPTSGSIGSIVVLNGTNLTNAGTITFAGASNNTVTTGFSVNAAGTQITNITVPPGAITGNVSVTTPGGTSNGVAFTVTVPTNNAPTWQTAIAPSTVTNSYSNVQGVATGPDGSIYLAGIFSGTVSFGSFGLTSVGAGDVFVARWNPGSSSFSWAQRAGSTSDDAATGVAVSGSNVYVTGNFRGTTASFGSTTLTNASASSADAFVTKLTDTGSFVWAQRAGGTSEEQANGVAVNGSSVYIAGTFTSSTASFGSTTLTNASAGSNDVFVAKLTDAGSAGSFTWAQRGGGPNGEDATALAVSGSSLYVTGNSNYGTFGSTQLSGGANGTGIPYVTKLTDAGSSGSFTWAYNDSGSSLGGGAYAVAVNGPSVYIAGAYSKYIGFFSGPYNVDFFVVKFTDAGSTASLTWDQRAGGNDLQSDFARALTVRGTSVYVAGYFGSALMTLGSSTLPNAGGNDVFVAKLNDAGSTASFDWARAAGGSNNDTANGLALSGTSVYTGGGVVPAANFGSLSIASPVGTYTGFLASLTDAVLPVITSLSPNNGPVGTTLTINGSDLTGTTLITFSGSSNNTVTTGFLVNATGTQITGVVVPNGAITGPVTVTTPSGTSNGLTFTVTTSLVLISTSPTANTRTAAVAGPVSATFSQAITSGSTAALKVFSSQRGGLRSATSGTTTVSGSTVSFAPSYALRPGETVQATVTTAATASAGGSLATPRVWRFTTAVPAGNGVFSGGSDPTVGSSPQNTTPADVDGDGDLDLLVANSGSNTVSVLLNNGSGTFSSGTAVSVGTRPYTVTAADLDGDGDLDLITANTSGSTASVRFNNGSGIFSGSTEVSVGNLPYGVTAGDVDGDGDLDLLTANYSSNTVSVRLNNGTGTFTAPATNADPAVGNGPAGLTLGDVDGDGDLDLLASNFNASTVSVRLNNGGGSFAGGSDVSVGSSPYGTTTADVDGDGDLDLLVANTGSNTVSIRINNGNGSFAGGTDVAMGNSPNGVAAADIDHDGDFDLLVPNENSSTVSVFFNNGSGTFSGTTTVAVGTKTSGIAAADLDGDGDLDFAAANFAGSTVSIRFNQGAALLPTLTSIAPTSGPVGTVVTLNGTNLTGTTTIIFAGASGNTVTTGFTVNVAGTQITGITVPSGAITGLVTVTTPGGTSNGVTFTVQTLASSLVGAYPFSGTTNDVSGLGHHATATGGGFGPDRNCAASTAYYLNGNPDYLNATTTTDYAMTTASELTVSVWVNPRRVPDTANPRDSANVIFSKYLGYTPAQSNYYASLFRSGGTTYVRLTGQGTDVLDLPLTGPVNGVWEQLTFVMKAGTGNTRVYRNGVLLGSGTLTYNAAASAQPFLLGRYAFASGNPYTYFQGGLDEVQVYNRALTAGEVASLYVAPAPTALAAPVATASPTSFPLGQSTTLSVTSPQPGVYYTWSGPGLVSTTGTSVTATPPAAGTIQYTVTASSGTCSAIGSVSVTVALTDLVVSTTQTLPGGTYNNVTITGPATGGPGILTLTGGLAVAGTLTVQNGGVLNTGCQVITGTGFTLAAGGTLSICDAAGITALGTAAGAIRTTTSRSFSTGANYSYNGTVAQATGTGLPGEVLNLTLNNPQPVTLTQPTSVRQVLAVQGSGSFLLNGQALTLLSDQAGTALVHNAGTGVVVGTATMQRAIDPGFNAGPGYRHYSAPVSNTTVADLATPGFTPTLNPAYNTATLASRAQPFPTVFGYDEARLTPGNGPASSPATDLSAFDKGFFSPAATDAMPVMAGYTVNIGASEVVDLRGTLNNGLISRPGLTRGAGPDAGWQFLGNPYPSPLDFSQTTGITRTNLDDAIYTFQSTGQYAGQYRSYINGIGNPLVSAMQGFYTRVSTGQTSGSFALNNAARVTTFGVNPSFNRTTADPRPLVQLRLQGSSTPLTDDTYVYFEAGASPAFDAHYDAYKLANSSGLSVGSLGAGAELSVNGLPLLTGPTTVPLNVWVPAPGTYTLSAATLANFGTGTPVYLLDAQTGARVLLSQQPQYSFSAASTALPGRFSLQFGLASPTATSAAALAGQVQVFPNPTHGRFTLLLPATFSATPVTARLLNALGQVVAERKLPLNAITVPFEVTGLAAGVYSLQLMNGTAEVVKRVVVE